ncbi:MAG: HEAT repeat domain-containing protein [Promethearchaeota archaeon]
MNFGDIWEVFGITTSFNGWTIGIIIMMLIGFFGGYLMMSSQVKLVKKEFWKWSDTLKCSFFAFFFGNGLTIISATIVTFILDNNDLGYQNHAIFLLLPLFFSLVFIGIYPLVEFLFMAYFDHEISATSFQKPFEKIIKALDSPWSYFAAIILYILFFILPPILMVAVFEIEFLIAWISWLLLYPMLIILYYASVGYIIAFGIFTVSIPYLPRSTFLHFDKSNRAVKEFFRDPLLYIVYGSLFYSYFYFIYQSIVTLARFNINYVSITPAYDMDWSIPISLFFAISAYFNRYWKRKVKSSSQSILFSSFLIAALCLNIIVNYLIVRPLVFEETLSTWNLTAVFYDLRGINSSNVAVSLYTQFNLIGVMEELMLFVIISYFFFFQKNHQFIKTTFIGTVTSSEEKFNPIPAFNMLRYKDLDQRKFAYESLIRMYHRIPNKRGYSLTQNRFKTPLFDALSDRSHIFAYQTSQKIFQSLMKDFPDKMLDILHEGLQSKNPDMITSIIESFNEETVSMIHNIDENIFVKLLVSKHYYHQLYTLRALNWKYSSELSHSSKPKTGGSTRNEDSNKSVEFVNHNIEIFLDMLKIPDVEIEYETLRLLSNFADEIDSSVFSNRLNHQSPKIQSVIAKIAGKISLESIDSLGVPQLLKMVTNVNTEIRSTVLLTLAKVGNFEKNGIPVSVFYDELFDRNVNIRKAAVQGMKSYLSEKPFALRTESIITDIKNQEGDIKKTLLKLLPTIWKQAPSLVFPILIDQLRSNDSELSKESKIVLLEMAQQDPKNVASQLIIHPETMSILKRGKIAETIIQIARKFPRLIVPLLVKNLTAGNEDSRMNAATVLSNISSEGLIEIPIEKIVKIWRAEPSEKIKSELTTVIQNLGIQNPKEIHPFLDQILSDYKSNKKSIKLNIAKLLVKLAHSDSEIIKIKYSEMLINEDVSSLRESGYEILGIIGDREPKKASKLLLKGLEDKEFGAKNESLKSLAYLTIKTKNPAILNEIVKLLQDKNKWTRKSALDVLSNLYKEGESLIKVKEILKILNIEKEDKDVLISLAKLLGNLKDEPLDIIFPIIVRLMQHKEEKVRNTAISSLVRYSNQVDSAILVPKMLVFLSDESSIHLEQSVAISLSKIVKYEKKDMKDRVISLLTIRAHHTQDKILQQTLAELKN